MCERCAEARGTLEEIRAARNAGLEELITLAPGEHWESSYWKGSWLQREWAEAPDRTLLRELRVKPYADEYAQATAERLEKRHAEYRKEYAKTRKEQLAENYANGGKEAARDRYLNGGGKEYARAYYLKKKEAKRLADLAIAETKGVMKNV